MQNDHLYMRVCTCLTWMHPFLKTGTFQRRASLSRAASSRTTSRRLSAAPGFFIVTTAQARLHPGHTHLTEGEDETDEVRTATDWPPLNKTSFKIISLYISISIYMTPWLHSEIKQLTRYQPIWFLPQCLHYITQLTQVLYQSTVM